MMRSPMTSGYFGGPAGTQHSGNSSSRNSMPYMQSTTKIPPGWSEEIAAKYPFRKWLEQLTLWCSSTKLEPHKIGPAIALRLGGTAYQIAIAMSKRAARNPSNGVVGNCLQYGEEMDFGDGMGYCHRGGYDILIYELSRKFGQLEQESVLNVLMDFFPIQERPRRNSRWTSCQMGTPKT